MAQKTILVVEDDQGYQDLMTALLGSEFAVRLSDSAADAFRLIQEGGATLVLLDLALMGASGFDLLEKMKAASLTEQIPVVICSCSSDPQTKKRAADLGAAGFLPKPFKNDVLLGLVRSLVA
jgi:DNA-binding NtrC family response regulator